MTPTDAQSRIFESPERPDRPVHPIRVKRNVKPERVKLGRQLRRDTRLSMRQRRSVVALSLGSISALGVIGLYQFGVTKHIPDLPLRRFKADAVSASGDGYLFETPDALLGIGSYALTAILAGMGPPDRAKKKPWLPLLLAAKVAVDTGNAVRLTAIQVRQLKMYCAWCLTTSAMTFATVPLIVPEMLEGWREMKEKFKRSTPGDAAARGVSGKRT